MNANCDLTVETGVVSRLLGISQQTLALWIKAGIFVPTIRGVGHGYRHKYSIRDVLALGTAKNLRLRGFTLGQAAKALAWIAAQTLSDLDAQWAQGYRYLLVVGDRLPTPRLMNKDEALAASAVAHEVGGPFPFALIDTEGAYNALCDKIALLNLERSKLETCSAEVAECKA